MTLSPLQKQMPLHLTSPLMHGPGVRNAQMLLKDNRFRNFKPGAIDSQYGEETAQATKHAHYWLGFPKRNVNRVFGYRLRQYLLGPEHPDQGGKALPLTYRLRRKRRLKQAAQVPVRIKALNRAITQIGVTESPMGSNDQKYGAWAQSEGWGSNGVAWCAYFFSWCETLSGRKFHYGFCPYITRDARNGANGLSVTHDPQPGDGIIYHWPGGNPEGDHIGRFVKWNDSHHSSFTAIEGNTGSTSNANGGQVQRRSDRYPTEVVIFFKVR